MSRAVRCHERSGLAHQHSEVRIGAKQQEFFLCDEAINEVFSYLGGLIPRQC